MPDKKRYTPVSKLKTPLAFIEYTRSLAIDIPIDEEINTTSDGSLHRPYILKSGRRIGNRFCALPMEGWDGTLEGFPSDLTRRRWKNFGSSGAKLIWGGEAAAVRHDGRCNPNQLLITRDTIPAIELLRKVLVDAHTQRFGSADGLLAGLQLTHSGRFSRPNDNNRLEPVIAYHHPYLDPLFHIPPGLPVITDLRLDDLIGSFVDAAVKAYTAGFDFVDIKHCHGYLGHELLSARIRPGKYGGCFENRTRFLRGIINGIRRDCPDLEIGVRLSVFDFPPFSADVPGGIGRCLYSPENGEYPYVFGANPVNPLQIQLDEVYSLLEMLQDLKVELICMSAGSPYYNPHIQRPALQPPSGGYMPPEDPLIGVARQIDTTAQLKNRFPDMTFVGSGYSYLQDLLPNVAQAVIREGYADFIGLGRMMFSYPELPADILEGKPVNKKQLCRTCSTCTTAPRRGLVSGCYLIDPFYKTMPESPLKSAH